MRLSPARRFALGAALCAACVHAPAALGGGGIYRVVESDGTVLYTNVLGRLPASRRARRMAPARPAPRLEGAPRELAAAGTDEADEAPDAPPPTGAATPPEGWAGEAPAQRAPGARRSLPEAVRTAATAKPELDEAIEAAAIKYRVPVALVWAVIHAESAFDPSAVSHVGASGLMQLMPGTAREMYVLDVFEPRQNIEGGTRYLRLLANEFDGDMVKMLAAYNAGPEAVRRHGGRVPPFAETQAYVRKVLALYFQYKARLGTVRREAPAE